MNLRELNQARKKLVEFVAHFQSGLHHHITLCFMAYAFLLLLQQASLKKNITVTLPQIRRWLNDLFQIIGCPYCKQYYTAHNERVFFNTS